MASGDEDADTPAVRTAGGSDGCWGEVGDGFDAGLAAGAVGARGAVSKARGSARGFHWCHTSSGKNLEHAT